MDITDIKLTDKFTFEGFIKYYSNVATNIKKIPTSIHYIDSNGGIISVIVGDAPPEAMKKGIQALLKKHKVESYFMQCKSLVDFPEDNLKNIDCIWYSAVNKYRMICDYHKQEDGKYKHFKYESVVEQNFLDDNRPYLLDLLYYDTVDDSEVPEMLGGSDNDN